MLICNCFISCYIGFYSFLPAFSWLICFLIMISWYQEFIGFIRRSSVYMCLIQTQQRRQTLFKTQLAVILSLMYTMSIENRTRQFFCMSYHIRKHKFLQGSSSYPYINHSSHKGHSHCVFRSLWDRIEPGKFCAWITKQYHTYMAYNIEIWQSVPIERKKERYISCQGNCTTGLSLFLGLEVVPVHAM